MNEKAAPKMMDTGTFYVETKVCTNCGQPIEQVGPRPARTERAAKAWVHSDNRSVYCHGRGDR